MLDRRSRLPAAIALIASVLGLVFASYSTLDYAAHLDRRLHDVHCSFIPGAPATSDAEACRAAMYSPYSALMREDYWGGIPISLFALGAFTFFFGFSVYLLVANGRAPRRAVTFFAAASLTPLLVSALMFTISVTQIGTLCKTCVGLYIASFLLAVGGLLGLATLREQPAAEPRPSVGMGLPLVWLVALGLITLVPAVVYAGSVPDHDKYLAQCGILKQQPTENDALLKLRTSRPVQTAILFEDPLCPTCKAFHHRLVHEGAFDKMNAQLSLFPLDSECNWMLDSPLHPGACIVSKAVICGGDAARDVLEWSYDEQERLTEAGKAGADALRAVIERRWGSAMLKCIDDRRTTVRLNKNLHFAVANAIPVSTPQMYLGQRRVCDEDTDIGLRYTLARLAPEVLR
jgi:uncharacterized membrane protein